MTCFAPKRNIYPIQIGKMGRETGKEMRIIQYIVCYLNCINSSAILKLARILFHLFQIIKIHKSPSQNCYIYWILYFCWIRSYVLILHYLKNPGIFFGDNGQLVAQNFHWIFLENISNLISDIHEILFTYWCYQLSWEII